MEMEELTKEFNRLDKAVWEIKKTLNIVHDAIVGNSLAKDGGMVQRLVDVEAQVEVLSSRLEAAEKKQIKYHVQTVIMWSSLGAVGMAVFVFLIEYVFKK